MTGVNGTSSRATTLPVNGSAHPGASRITRLRSLAVQLRSRAVSGAKLLAAADTPDRAIVEGMVGEMDLVLLTGEEKVALKTWLALDLVVARVAGGTWLGRRVESCGRSRCLVVSAEMRAASIGRRLRALCIGRGLDPSEVLRQIAVIDEAIPLVARADRETTRMRTIRRAYERFSSTYDPKRRAEIFAERDKLGDMAEREMGDGASAWDAVADSPTGTFGLIVVDTLRQVLVGDENSSADVACLTRAAREVARGAECPLLITHHTGKGRGDGTSARAARGSVEVTAGPDVLLTAHANRDDELTMHFRCRDREAPDPVRYQLAVADDGVRIEAVAPGDDTGGGRTDASTARAGDAVLAALRASAGPMSLRQLREAAACRPETLTRAVDHLRTCGAVTTSPGPRKATLVALSEASA